MIFYLTSVVCDVAKDMSVVLKILSQKLIKICKQIRQNENHNTGKVFVLASQRRGGTENFALFIRKYKRLIYFQLFG